MIEAISTGKNECYGKKGEIIRFCNNNLEYVLREGLIIEKTIKFLPSYSGKKRTIKEKIKPTLMPEKKVYIHNKIDIMDGNIERILKVIKEVVKRQKELKELLNKLSS